jgi:prolyl-tRNA synthetase
LRLKAAALKGLNKVAKEKKQVEQITDMDVDFAQWYTDVVLKAELIDYSGVKGLMVLRPYGYAIWENIQKVLDGMFKETGHENVAMPLLIPESLLQKEKDHVEGFAPEVAWVTHGGNEELTERLCIRPTSETLFCEHWNHVLHSWRDLPMLYNQWCSVLRWEKTTRPFLRGREFHWQEGHTLHATAEEAMAETMQQLETYANFCENWLAMPVIRGRKTEKEKFAGAVATYTVECMMHDTKALQSGTSHYFGDGFAKAFDITFTDKNNQLAYPHQTSWGLSTRIIGGIIMTHGDNNGLVLPPKIAPIQAIVIPIAMHKEGVKEKANELLCRLRDAGLRVKADFSDYSPGWKFAEYEMKGIPLRVEIGPKDIENGQCIAVRRDNGEKVVLSLAELEEKVKELLDSVQQGLFDKAKRNLVENTFDASTADEIKEIIETKGGFIRTKWCGATECELKLKEYAGVTSRCIPLEQDGKTGPCPVCGKTSDTTIIWGVAY